MSKRLKPSAPLSALERRREIFALARKAVVAVAFGHPDKKGDFGLISGPVRSYISIFGTGFCYDRRGYVLTAGHVLDEAHKAWVACDLAGKERPDILCVVCLPGRRDPDGDWVTRFETAFVKNSYRAHPGDVAVFDLGLPKPENEFAPLELSNEPAQLGDEVMACGFPLGLRLHESEAVNPSFAAGIISGILPDHEADPEMRTRLQLDAVAHGGSSGGPVCDIHTGRVIGLTIQAAVREERIFTAKDQTIEIPLGMAFAEDVTWIRQVTVAAERAFLAGKLGPIHQAGQPPV